MKWFHAIQQRLIHLWKAKERHGVHSPLIYQLMEKDLRIELPSSLHIITDYRQQLMRQPIEWVAQDHGAGSRLNATKILSTAVKRASSNEKKGAFLYRWTHRFQPKTILELGTHVGISAGYLYLANPNAHLITIEGDPFLAGYAQAFFKTHHWNILSMIGTFDEKLSEVFSKEANIDLAVIDGHHNKQATLHYLELIAHHVSQDAWILIDDIHWSKEMTEAWDSIVHDERYALTLDFYQYGAIFMGKRNQKEHFILKW